MSTFVSSLGNVFNSSGQVMSIEKNEIRSNASIERKTILSAIEELDLKVDTNVSSGISASRALLAKKKSLQQEKQTKELFSFDQLSKSIGTPVITTGLNQAVNGFTTELTTLSVGDKQRKQLKSRKSGRRHAKAIDRGENYEEKSDRKTLRRMKRKERRNRLKSVY